MAERRSRSALVSVFMLFLAISTPRAEEPPKSLKPRILIATLVRNKAHSLPYFLWYLENLDYPKDRLSLWIRSDHNSDNSTDQLKAWLDHVQDQYHSYDYEFDDSSTGYRDETGPIHWSEERFSHVMRLRQAALDAGRRLWADFVFMVDADVILRNPNTLQHLIDQDKTIVAPLLNVTASENYANFWGEMDESGYYRRSENYFSIKEREILGCFAVAMVHSALLINLNHIDSQKIAYYPPPPRYVGPFDDIIVFAHSVNFANVKMYIFNEVFFGFVPLPMENHNTVAEEAEQFVHVKTDSIVDDVPITRVPYLYPPPLVEKKDKMGFDQVYMINLKRRPDRRKKMEECFEEIGIDYQYVEAVDGKLLNVSYLQSLHVRMLPGYKDPYHGRPLTRGEIGCFLSHYAVWQDVLAKGYEKVLVFEDDIRFEPYFRRKLGYMMEEVKHIKLNWDLIYLGRRSENNKEIPVPRTSSIVRPGYSYWTISYILSHRGAKKFLQQDPLSKLMALDEYFMVLMSNTHPIYLGRKKLRFTDEKFLENSKNLVYPHYSYWTLSYLVTREGIEKMMSHKPLSKLIPIDEFIPILFDKHSEDEWRTQFHPRNLHGFSVEPLLVYPTRYTGEPGYVTDTDDSDVLNFDEDGVLHDGEWEPPDWDEDGYEFEERPTPAEKKGHFLRGDIDELPQGKDEL